METTKKVLLTVALPLALVMAGLFAGLVLFAEKPLDNRIGELILTVYFVCVMALVDHWMRSHAVDDDMLESVADLGRMPTVWNRGKLNGNNVFVVVACVVETLQLMYFPVVKSQNVLAGLEIPTSLAILDLSRFGVSFSDAYVSLMVLMGVCICVLVAAVGGKRWCMVQAERWQKRVGVNAGRVFSLLYLPLVSIVFAALECNSAGLVARDSRVSCWQGTHKQFAAVSLFGLPLFVFVANLMSAVMGQQAELVDEDSWAMAGRGVVDSNTTKMIMVGLVSLISNELFSGMIILVSSVTLVSLSLRASPYNSGEYRAVRSCLLLNVVWLAVCSVIDRVLVLTTNSSATEIVSINEPVAVLWVLGCVFILLWLAMTLYAGRFFATHLNQDCCVGGNCWRMDCVGDDVGDDLELDPTSPFSYRSMNSRSKAADRVPLASRRAERTNWLM